MRKRKPLWMILGGGFLAVIAILFAGRFALAMFAPHIYSGSVFQDSTEAPPMEGLSLHTGEPVDLADFADEVVIIYYGYTHCPDVCPTTLTDVANAIDLLGSKGERVSLMMISVDPERDSLEFTGEYVQFFHQNFYGVGGSINDVTLAATRYGVYFAKTETDENNNYEMDHTASLLGIDPQGNLRIIWPPGISPDALAADLDALLR